MAEACGVRKRCPAAVAQSDVMRWTRQAPTEATVRSARYGLPRRSATVEPPAAG